jgi:hypothetical protein
MAKDTLTITDNRTGKVYELPIQLGTIKALDLRQIKVSESDFGLMTYDPALTNTASCKSRITFIDGDRGILNYRGYPIEQLAEKSQYLETAYLILHGDLPAKAPYEAFVHSITHHTPGPREHQGADGGVPLRRPPHGHADVHGGGALDLLSRGQAHPRRGQPARADLPAHRQDPHPGRLRLSPLGRDAVRLPRQRPLLLRELPADDVQDGGGATRSTR